MQFMQAGGIFMWIMLAVALLSGIFAMTKQDEGRSALLFRGALICLGLAGVGFALGMNNTIHFVNTADISDAEKLSILMIGLKELANNILFGGLLACLLVGASLLTPQRSLMRKSA